MSAAILAALAMLATDVLATIMVQAEAANKRKLAALMDTAGWLVSIQTTTISVTGLQGHNMLNKVYIYVFVSAANFYGTWLGVGIGAKLTKRKAEHEGALTGALKRRHNRDALTVRAVRR